MITVHHLAHSRSQRVLWLLEELGLPYTVQRYERDPQTQLAPAALQAVHPLGKSPVITDGPLTVAESGAILTYLVEGPGQGRLKPPPGSPQAWAWNYWMHAAEGSAMPLLVLSLVMHQVAHPRLARPLKWLVQPVARGIADQVMSRYVLPNLRAQWAYIDAHLAATGWFAGDTLTAADIQMSFPLEAAHHRGWLGPQYPHIQAFLQRMAQRPAYQKALAVGGPYQYGVKA